MQINIIRTKFLDALKQVQNVADSKNTLPILANVKMEAKDGKVTMCATNLDVTVISTVDCEVVEAGVTTLPVKLLAIVIGKMVEGPINMKVDDKFRATLTGGSAVYHLSGLDPAEFPTLPKSEDGKTIIMPQAVMKEVIRKVIYAASKDDTRRTLKGILMSFKDGKATTVATDGRRLSLVEVEVDSAKGNDMDVILPPIGIAELVRSLSSTGDIELKVEKSQMSFTFGNVKIYSKLFDDAYPNYHQVIPKNNDKRVTVDRKMLMDAIDRVSVLSDPTTNASVRMVFDAGMMTIQSATEDIGEARDSLPVKYDGEKVEICFNPFYVIDPLKALDDDEVFIELLDGHSPIAIKASIPFIGVVMPLRFS